jgi:hypothetical protein
MNSTAFPLAWIAQPFEIGSTDMDTSFPLGYIALEKPMDARSAPMLANRSQI